jgi:uncharacterized protein (DUF885 family)
MLGNEMHRGGAVVDTGIHSKGWTREQAIQFSMANEAESEAAIQLKLNATWLFLDKPYHYKIGQLKIMELRQRAQDKMG